MVHGLRELRPKVLKDSQLDEIPIITQNPLRKNSESPGGS